MPILMWQKKSKEREGQKGSNPRGRENRPMDNSVMRAPERKEFPMHSHI